TASSNSFAASAPKRSSRTCNTYLRAWICSPSSMNSCTSGESLICSLPKMDSTSKSAMTSSFPLPRPGGLPETVTLPAQLLVLSVGPDRTLEIPADLAVAGRPPDADEAGLAIVPLSDRGQGVPPRAEHQCLHPGAPRVEATLLLPRPRVPQVDSTRP